MRDDGEEEEVVVRRTTRVRVSEIIRETPCFRGAISG